MKVNNFLILIITSSTFLTACSTIPESSTVHILPGSKKTQQDYIKDKNICLTMAKDEVEKKYSKQSTEQTTGDNIFIGTVIGGVLGSIIGGSSRSAAAGAVTGGVIGGLSAQGDIQLKRQAYFDAVFSTCMYDNGHKVPASSIIYVQKEEPVKKKDNEQKKTTPNILTPYGVPPDFKKQ